MEAQDKHQNPPIDYVDRVSNHEIVKMLVGEGAKKHM